MDKNQPSVADHTTANEPPPIRQLSAPELQAWMASGTPFELVDVRTDEERALARIAGSRLLDQASHDALLCLDRDTCIIFQCHHGVQSTGRHRRIVAHGLCRRTAVLVCW